jgi:hypothetical protein
MSYLHSVEKKIVKKIYGPIKEEESQGIRMNKQLQDILQEADIANFIKLLGLRWYAHAEQNE